jgi:molybdopterin-guanine dinucleotide biosynthesis protein A
MIERAVSAAILAGGRARRMQGLDKSALDIGGRSILSRQINVLQALTSEWLIVGHPTQAALAPTRAALAGVHARTLLPRVTDKLARRDLEMAGLIREARRVEIGPDELARFDPEALMLCNVNTPHDYRQACSRAFNR